jgi:hypothetical protein
MAAQGAEVVSGDLDDVDSLKRAFKGAYGVYGITDCECVFCQLGSFSLPIGWCTGDGRREKSMPAPNVSFVDCCGLRTEGQSAHHRINGSTNVNGDTVFSCTSPEQEILQGKNIVDAAKECGIQHMVWSTLERTEYKIIHFETK